jgi:hypothetical protein
MTFPPLPRTAPREVLMVCTCYENGRPLWGDVLGAIGGRREGEVIALPAGEVRLRMAEDPGWHYMHGGDVPALVPSGPVPPVVVLVDIPVVYGGDGPLLVDLATTPGRGVRVPAARLGEILGSVLDGALSFDDLVRDMDRHGMYQGDAGRRAFAVPAAPPRRSFPALPAAREAALLVRTCFDDEEGWRALLGELNGIDDESWVGADLDPDDFDEDSYPLTALVVDDRDFEGLLPGEVPALVPPGQDTTLVALADARTFAEPGRPLTVVDLYDVPGQTAVLPCRQVGSMACNLEIANMDFLDFVAVEGERPWWDG